jgi:hypothetical protein
MKVLPPFRVNAPSSKHLQEQSSTIWWTNTCLWHGGNTTLQLHSQLCFGACFLQSQKVLFIAEAALWAVGEVMTLSPRDTGTCSLCMFKGDDITFSDSQRLCLLRINDA